MMVKNKVDSDVGRLDDIQKDVIHFERLIGDLVGILSKSISFCIHSGESVNELVNRLTRNCEGMNDKNGDDPHIIIQESSFLNENDATMNNNDNGIDYIRFTSNGPVYSLPKRIANSLVGSLLYEYSQENIKTVDGTIYLDYPDDETVAPLLIDSLMNNKMNVDKLSLGDQIDLLRMFDYCNLPIPEELVKRFYKTDSYMILYEEDYDVILYINDKRDNRLNEYLKRNGLWNKIVNNYCFGYVDFDKKNNEIELLENEMYGLFGDKGIGAISEGLIKCLFKGSSIIVNRVLDTPLVNWLGKEKKWKLLFRASERNYSASEFHRFCDNKGETVTIIKHIGHNNHINIFGGYTDQNWAGSDYKPYSKEFLFSLNNEHDIPPTKYDNTNSSYGICCYSFNGPVFGYGCDIYISDQCHSNTNSYCNAHSYSEVNTPQKSSLFVNTDDANSNNYFKLDDYEVWGRT
ncbi:hypothetical protein WA158_006630 [Blastocystis sp. Blastoise]